MIEYLSNCCGASIINQDICSKCKEHCEPEPELPDTWFVPSSTIATTSEEEFDCSMSEECFCEDCKGNQIWMDR